jgi:hypothetical protein
MPAYVHTDPVEDSPLASSPVRGNFEGAAYVFGGVNLLADPLMKIWPRGDDADPAHFYTEGGCDISRETFGAKAADCPAPGDMYALITAGVGSAGYVKQDLLAAADYDSYFDGKHFGLGAAVLCDEVESARIGVDDGSGTVQWSDWHTGGGDWEWLTVAAEIDPSATCITVLLQVAAEVEAGVVGWTMLRGPAVPLCYHPSPKAYGTLLFPVAGVLETGTNVFRYQFARPALVKHIQLRCETAPATQALILDINQWDGALMQSMFGATLPQIAAAGYNGGRAPDGTYSYRCFLGVFDDADPAYSLLSGDIDQVGTGTAGSNLTAHVRGLQFLPPFEDMVSYDFQGVS